MIGPPVAVSRSLPILTFDEAVLGPSLGYVFDPRWLDPYESIVSMLWKFARVNALAGHILAGQLRAAPIDPYEGVAASSSAIEVRRVARMLGITMKAVRCGLGWRALDPRLRHCPRCMSSGYHSVVHQYLGAMQCPAHGDWLVEGCSACGHASDYRLDAQLLDAPFRCARCRRPYGRYLASLTSPRPRGRSERFRIAITRAYYRA